MSLTNKIKTLEFPNVEDIFKSGKKVKNKMAGMDTNEINVHFYYADNRFKNTIKGTIKHECEIPIVYLEYPEKLAFIIPENTLVYDVKLQCFEISVNEKYTHAVQIKNNIENKDDYKEYILPVIPDKYEYEIIKVEGIKDKDTKEDIVLTSKILSSLGRAKILERTLETSNDGLMIMFLIGGLVGLCIGLIINLNAGA